jgi:hypothetical protein
VTAALKPAMPASDYVTCLVDEYRDGTIYLSEGDLSVDDRHSVAAILLNGLTDAQGAQLGFSWEDVDLLSEKLRIGGYRYCHEELEALAARIAALLPPRGTT